jgi:hypothetical protein
MTLRTASAAVLLAASLAHAQIATLPADVWTDVASAKVKSILREMGLDAAEKTGEKSTVFNFRLAGHGVSLDSHTSFMELQLALSDKVNAAAMNEWNRTHRFTRAYMDTDGGATLEADLDYGGGVTKAAIEAFIKGFGDVIPGFAKAVLEAGVAGGGLPAAAYQAATGGGSGGSGILTILEGRMSVRYDPSKWHRTPTSVAGRLEFSHVSGAGFAVVIAEHTAVSADTVADIGFANIRKQDSGARMTLKEKRHIAGGDVWFQTVDATIMGMPLTYYGYYYGGPGGAVQVLTYAGRSLIGGYQKDFLEFLDGLRVAD